MCGGDGICVDSCEVIGIVCVGVVDKIVMLVEVYDVMVIGVGRGRVMGTGMGSVIGGYLY